MCSHGSLASDDSLSDTYLVAYVSIIGSRASTVSMGVIKNRSSDVCGQREPSFSQSLPSSPYCHIGVVGRAYL